MRIEVYPPVNESKKYSIVISGGLASRMDSYQLLQEIILLSFLGFDTIAMDDFGRDDTAIERREKIYEYLTREQHVESRKIIWKGCCWSGLKMFTIAKNTDTFFIGDQTSDNMAEVGARKSNMEVGIIFQKIVLYACSFFWTYYPKRGEESFANYKKAIFIHNDDDNCISEGKRRQLMQLQVAKHIHMQAKIHDKIPHGAAWWHQFNARNEMIEFLESLRDNR